MHPNHEPALFMIQSGRIIPGRPTMGSWIAYGLGTENQNLPAYVVLDDPPLGLPVNGPQNWQAGFLPPLYQGTRIRSTGSPILSLAPEVPESFGGRAGQPRPVGPPGSDPQAEPRPNQLPNSMRASRVTSWPRNCKNERHGCPGHQQRKQRRTLDMYGVGQEPTDSYARRCIMAPATHRARCPFCPALYQQPDMGQPHLPGPRFESCLGSYGQACCRVGEGSEAARALEGYLGDLGRRIWAHADCPDGEKWDGRTGRTGPQSQRVHHLDGWRGA